MVWKVLGTGAAVVAGGAARKAVSSLWQRTTGSLPPDHPENPDSSLGQALAWAAVSGVAIATVKVLATRQAAKYYRTSAGHLPKALRKAQRSN